MTANPGGSFTDNFVSMADDLGAWLSNGLDLSKFVTFADSTAATAVTAPKAPAEVAQGVSDVADAAGQAVGNVVGGIQQTLNRDMGYLALGGVGLLALAVLLRSPRRRRRRR